MNQKSDIELVREVQQGDLFAFETLVKRYQRGIVSFVYRIVHNFETAEEVGQDTFFKLYQTIERLDTSKRFSTYLFEIAKNTAISTLRKQHKEVRLDEMAEIAEDESFYEALAQSEKERSVREAVAELEEKYRLVLRLYYFDDLSYEEISTRLKLPLNTVRTHLRRAREALKPLLAYEKR